MPTKDKPKNSPLVKGSKYRQLKKDFQQLQAQNVQLIRELGVLNKKYVNTSL